MASGQIHAAESSILTVFTLCLNCLDGSVAKFNNVQKPLKVKEKSVFL